MEMEDLAKQIELGFGAIRNSSAEDRGVTRQLAENVQDLTRRLSIIEDRFQNGLPSKAICQTLHVAIEKDLKDIKRSSEEQTNEAKAIAYSANNRMWAFLGGLAVTAITSIGGLIAALAALGGHSVPKP